MSDLYIKQELLKTLPQIDAILLDIDGVVLNVSASYRAVIVETTQYFATQVMKLEDTGTLLEAHEIDLFKLAGGFNSDWDLASAAVALVVAKHAISGATDTATLREQAPSWEEYTTECKLRGTHTQAAGFTNGEAYILEKLTPKQRREFATTFNPKLVVQLFQEMYGGDTACKDLYGFEPEHIHTDGYYLRETVLLDPALISPKLKVGVLTGRNNTETELALKIAGLTERVPRSAWVTDDDGVRKPDGNALGLLRDRMEFNFGVYIGDTMDDMRVVQNFRDTRGAGRAKIVSCTALSGPSGEAHRRLFLEAGSEIVAPDANTFLQYLKHAQKS